ncbi:uncharacterized protein [Clytia hemisphaerica]|uniref:uncharacterized protein n=1 Tax=Clytia hemisphaerica TaxID=252671 RepID=UPI0034D761A1
MTRARRNYEQNICNKAKSNPKVFWSHVRSKMKSASGVSSLLETPKDKSSLRHEFCSVFTNEPEGEVPDFPSRTEEIIDDIVITKEMLSKKIKELDTNKSLGPDEIHPKMLKELVDEIAEPLSRIMNKTLTEGELPEDWKLAHVTPIYKNKGAHNLAVNYRPKDVDTLNKWSKDWLLKFHPDKCHVLTLGKLANIKHAHPYSLAGNQLEHVFEEKDLGVLVDAELMFEEHIAKQVNKANSTLGIIRRGFDNLTPKTITTLYSAFVRPHLEYAQSVWSPKLRKHVNMLEGVQRRASKLIPIYRHLPYSERLKRLGLPTLEFRRQFCDMVQVYKHLSFYDKDTIPSKLISRARPKRRHSKELLPNFANDRFNGPQTKSFYYRCVPTWNKLPREVVSAQSIKSFKEKLNDAWKNHPQKFVTRGM